MDDVIKLPRLYVDDDLVAGGTVTFGADQAHYLRSVLRRDPGDGVRLFNGRDGEWLATMAEIGKKAVTATVTQVLRAQPPAPAPLHLYFAPIKKARMDILIEKAVELGVTALHPVLTQNVEVRQVNEDRLRAQMIEAAEQCERLTIPALNPAAALKTAIPGAGPLYACIERADAPLPDASGPRAVLIGPEGGFTAEERDFLLSCPGVVPASLGPLTLRAETAALAALVRMGQ